MFIYCSKLLFIFFFLFQMKNPWQVDSIEAFVCLKCPECYFTSKQENLFQDHAVQCHPLSHVLFGMIKLECDANKEKQRYDQKYFKNYLHVNSSKQSDVFRDSTETFLNKIVSDDDQNVEEKQRYDQKYFENYQHVNSAKHSDVFRESTETFLNKIGSDDDQNVLALDSNVLPL